MPDLNKRFDTPILFLTFNRLDHTKRVFNEIKKIKPKKFYVVSDGARGKVENEDKIVLQIREYLTSNVNWECELKTLFRNENLGCKISVSGAIDWFFRNEEMGIILEDDCLPSQSFFWYCQELLLKYKGTKKIFSITGYNFLNKWNEKDVSYFYSNLGGIWGWATWKDRWQFFDLNVNAFKEFNEQGGFERIFGNKHGKVRSLEIYNAIFKYKLDSWAYPWAVARHVNNGLVCVPSKNLVKNIGFDFKATHTLSFTKKKSIAHDIDFPLIINSKIEADLKFDKKYLEKKNIFQRIIPRLKKMIY